MLEAPERTRASRGAGARSPETARRTAGAPAPRRDLSEDFAERRSSFPQGSCPGAGTYAGAAADEDFALPRRSPGMRIRLRGGLPRSVAGRVFAALALMSACGLFTAGVWEARALVLRDPRLVIQSSSSIQIAGNDHLSRAQLLSVFGDDVDRNILSIALADRRQELESLPWVEHATVMRLLPNKLRVAIVERTPVAFVRHAGHIGLVDAGGVLLEMATNPDAPAGTGRASYSFPVVTGIDQADPLSTRAARMQLYRRFLADLDSGKEKYSATVSEVDLSDPEDVRALIADEASKSDILVHFGQDGFLTRYERYRKNLPEWRIQYPKLAAVDMRYERQVVLEMTPGTPVPVSEATQPAEKKAPSAAPKAKAKPLARPAQKVPAKPAAARPAPAKPAPTAAAARPHLETAFDVHPKASAAPAHPHAAQVGPQ